MRASSTSFLFVYSQLNVWSSNLFGQCDWYFCDKWVRAYTGHVGSLNVVILTLTGQGSGREKCLTDIQREREREGELRA